MRIASPPVVVAADQSLAPTDLHNPVAPTLAEIIPPAPPSGDFELALTPEALRAIVEKKYRGFLAGLTLPPDRQHRLWELLMERQQVTVDAANAALLFGLNPIRDLPAIQRAIEQFQSSVDTTLRTEFGESVYATYRDFDHSIRERNSIDDFARQLASAQEPLAPEQEKQMVQILKKSPGPDFPPDLEGVIYGGLTEQARISEQAVAAAATILSPGQLAVFRQFKEREPHESNTR